MKPFANEAELCRHFIAAIPSDWVAYAETGGWDILLVRKSDGFQIGIQAKMKFNPQVLHQALDDSYHAANQAGPDCRAVLVPWGTTQQHMANICAYVGVTVISCAREAPQRWHNRIFEPDLPSGRKSWFEERDWHELGPARRIKLPEYVPDVSAGARAPLQLTDWKIKALKIAATIELRGFVTRKDFAHHKIDHRLWMAPRPGGSWLVLEGGVFKRGPTMPDFARQHPKVYAEIKAEAPQWMPKDGGIANQGTML